MPLSASEKLFLSLIRGCICGGFDDSACESGYLSALTDGDTLGGLFTLAAEQKLLPVMYEGAVISGGFPEKFISSLRSAAISQVVSETRRGESFSAIYSHIISRGLHPLVVKGRLCAALYPNPEARISSDDDILIPEDEFARCLDELLALGLTIDEPKKNINSAYEISLSGAESLGNVHIELHRRLFDPADKVFGGFNRFFDGVHERRSEYRDTAFLSMPPDEHLLYLILHAYKHFALRGVGVRQFCDIGLWAREYRGVIGWERLASSCREARAEVFAAAVFDIARTHLGIAVPDDVFPLSGDVSSLPLLCDSLSGGIYGSNSSERLHSSTVTLDALGSSRGGRGRRSLMRSVFPPLEYMRGSYTYLEKHPALLPFSWFARLFRYGCEITRAGKPSSAAESVKLGRERTELLRLYGII